MCRSSFQCFQFSQRLRLAITRLTIATIKLPAGNADRIHHRPQRRRHTSSSAPRWKQIAADLDDVFSDEKTTD
jgi:hypothetical protein